MKNDQIRKAVCKNRGGLEGASDADIKVIWDSLQPETKKQYMESVKESKNVSPGNKSQRDV